MNNHNFLESHEGCCCNCKWQVKINKHPWNHNSLFKGSITDTIAFGCAYPEHECVILFEKEHGYCEVYERKQDE